MKLNLFKNIPEKEKKLTLSTQITLLRIIATPFIVAAIISQYWAIVFWLIVFAAISDIADGKVARARNEITALGAALDPIADKLFILSSYFALAYVNVPLLSVPVWFFWLVFFKELLLIIGGIILYQFKGNVISAVWIGKIAMVVQTVFIAGLSLCYYFGWHPFITYNIMLSVVVFFVLASLFQYLKLGINQVRVYENIKN